MKKNLLFALITVILLFCACGKQESAPDKPSASAEISTISGTITLTLWDLIPDYNFHDQIPTIAIVSEFQNTAFSLYVGEEIAKELVSGNTYVFSIEPFDVKVPKDVLKEMETATLCSLIPFKNIKNYRLATEAELGLDSLTLTIE